jgi:hypothetical protein
VVPALLNSVVDTAEQSVPQPGCFISARIPHYPLDLGAEGPKAHLDVVTLLVPEFLCCCVGTIWSHSICLLHRTLCVRVTGVFKLKLILRHFAATL